MSFKVSKGINKVPFSIRVDEEDYNIIHSLSIESKKSYNYIINAMIKNSIANMELEDIKKLKIEDSQ